MNTCGGDRFTLCSGLVEIEASIVEIGHVNKTRPRTAEPIMHSVMSLLGFALLAALGACAQQKVTMNIHGDDPSIVVPIIDLRPNKEKESEIFSRWMTSSSFGIYRKGDETLDPPMSEVLRRRAHEKLSFNGAKPLSISIHHLVTYVNSKSNMRTGALMGGLGPAILGPVGSLGTVIGAGIKSNPNFSVSHAIVDRARFEAEPDEIRRALYTEQENPKDTGVYIVYIDAEINGQRHFTKTISAIGNFKPSDAYVAAVESAIEYFLAQFQPGGLPEPVSVTPTSE